jgi:lipopolysaccharide export system ATP-binding protein
MEPSSLEARELVKKFHRRKVVDNVSVKIRQGEIVGLLGPNGAGKTTTFRIITGEIHASGGTIRLDDMDITDLPMYRRARLGVSYLPQEPSAFRTLTTEENILVPLEMNGYPKPVLKERLEEVLERFRLQRHRTMKVRDLSGGERRRVEIARAFALRPRFMLLDEPFAGLDPIAVEELQRIVEGLRSQNIGVLVTDHNVHETLEITDRAYIIFEGRILVQGTPAEIIEHEYAKRIFLGEKFRLRT